MYKEMIISIILVVLILIGDFISQNYTKNSTNFLTDELEILKQSLSEKDFDKAEEKVQQINKKWNEVHDKLAYYIEHNELEKVEIALTACKSFTETRDYDLAISELEKTIFVLDHITDKYSFNLVNIF